MTVVDLPEIQAQGAARALGQALATVARPELDGFWVHMDVDVLDDALMPAVDYRHPGGLCWNEAAEILGGLVADEGARGVEITIFNPRLDPSAAIAPRLADLIAFAVLSRQDGEPGT